ncbi:hypothetical protein BPAE_0086g00020 [Botrytis paeoniae]|uniref:Uncharacterized protein n=1 Tax=Botrytis paeoniae TaxID=278948 RepID=A0A4Z1FNP7_9HELO|nr:hypothetical protein BPAE_0086g00020 [Botrytis paeoniae]
MSCHQILYMLDGHQVTKTKIRRGNFDEGIEKNGESIDTVIVEMNQGPEGPMEKLKRNVIQSTEVYHKNRQLRNAASHAPTCMSG